MLGFASLKHQTRREIEEAEIDEDTWYDDDESVLGDYETELANMSDEDYEEMLEALGEYPLEYRLAIIFIHVAYADGDFSKAEKKELTTYLQDVFDKLGSEYEAKDVIKYCWEETGDDEALLEESVALLGEYLSQEMLATIINDLEQVVGVDDLEDEESEFIDYLISEWQIEE